MKLKLLSEAYHYGDLNIASKAETRREQTGYRNTGGFGTGFYCVGSLNPNGYRDRDIWEIDLSKYKLYKPRNNNDAYKLHDALLNLNNLSIWFDFPYPWMGKTEEELQTELYEMEDKNDERGILGFINKYDSTPNKDIINKDDLDDEIERGRWGRVEKMVLDFISDVGDINSKIGYTVQALSSMFSVDKKDVLDLLNFYRDYKGEDTLATLFMKSLGYEGVDVTHLSSDEDGLRGLDNFAYGSVVYDLKPGTYRKINSVFGEIREALKQAIRYERERKK